MNKGLLVLTIIMALTVPSNILSARKHHLDFIKETWQRPESFQIGLHVSAICNKIDTVLEDYNNGISSFLIIKCPFRHSKSTLLSHYLVPHYLGLFPDNEVMLAAYSADYATQLSRYARDIISSDKYRKVFPFIQLDKDARSVQNWQLEGFNGLTHWSGVGGAQTGKGYQLGIIDDYLKNRQDAESSVVRDRQWEWFTQVFLTRRAPTSITIIVATPWHTDDIIGRIGTEMNKSSYFPRFETIEFPAFSDKYPEGVLFPQRYDRKWYDEQRAALGPYGTASLLQCNPESRTGNLFNISKLKTITENDVPEGVIFCRAWDLSSTSAELVKQDPDYTVGALVGIDWEKRAMVEEYIPHIYIKNIVRVREEAPARNKLIKDTALKDGPEVEVAIEQVAGYKDTVTQMRELLSGIRNVTGITVSKDKIVRSTPIQIAMDAGNVSVVTGNWNESLKSELISFPSGKHDDQVDALSVAYEYLNGGGNMLVWKNLPKIEVTDRPSGDPLRNVT